MSRFELGDRVTCTHIDYENKLGTVVDYGARKTALIDDPWQPAIHPERPDEWDCYIIRFDDHARYTEVAEFYLVPANLSTPEEIEQYLNS